VLRLRSDAGDHLDGGVTTRTTASGVGPRRPLHCLRRLFPRAADDVLFAPHPEVPTRHAWWLHHEALSPNDPGLRTQPGCDGARLHGAHVGRRASGDQRRKDRQARSCRQYRTGERRAGRRRVQGFDLGQRVAVHRGSSDRNRRTARVGPASSSRLDEYQSNRTRLIERG